MTTVECSLGNDRPSESERLLFDRSAEIRFYIESEWTFFVRLTQTRKKPTLSLNSSQYIDGINTLTHTPRYREWERHTYRKHIVHYSAWLGLAYGICCVHEKLVVNVFLICAVNERFSNGKPFHRSEILGTTTHSCIANDDLFSACYSWLDDSHCRLCVIMMRRKAFSKDNVFSRCVWACICAPHSKMYTVCVCMCALYWMNPYIKPPIRIR